MISEDEILLVDEEIGFIETRIEVDKGQNPIRIDAFLTAKIQNASRNKIQHGIEAGLVLVNGQLVKPSYKVKPGDSVFYSYQETPRNKEILPENIPLEIVFEDDFLLIVNKPAGMVVHPAHGNWTGTLVNGLIFHFDHLPTLDTNAPRPGLVHRIDKDTSGLLIVAKNDLALAGLSKQFFYHSIKRVYHALIWGEPKNTSGTIDANIGRSLKDRKLMEAFPDGSFGKSAVTHYKMLESFKYVSLIECRLETGRTHQIRAHMKYLGHPIFSDRSYGGHNILKGKATTNFKSFVNTCFKICPRQALHAKTIGFEHPVTKEFLFFDSQLPPDFSELLQNWRLFNSKENT